MKPYKNLASELLHCSNGIGVTFWQLAVDWPIYEPNIISWGRIAAPLITGFVSRRSIRSTRETTGDLICLRVQMKANRIYLTDYCNYYMDISSQLLHPVPSLAYRRYSRGLLIKTSPPGAVWGPTTSERPVPADIRSFIDMRAYSTTPFQSKSKGLEPFDNNFQL